MPHERTRSIRWGWELLAAIADDPEIEQGIRHEAASIQATYPAPEFITRLIDADASGLPPPAAQSISEAADLFIRLRLNLQGTAETRQHLVFTLRHFPKPTDLRLMGSQSTHFRITDSLLPEDWYDRR